MHLQLLPATSEAKAPRLHGIGIESPGVDQVALPLLAWKLLWGVGLVEHLHIQLTGI